MFRSRVLQSDFAILSLILLGTGTVAGPLHPLVKTAGKYAVSGPCGDLLSVDCFTLTRSRRACPAGGGRSSGLTSRALQVLASQRSSAFEVPPAPPGRRSIRA